MPARLIVYPLFFILKDFLIAYLLAKTETPKKPEIGFFPIGVIASVSELAGFWFIQMFAGEATVRRYGDNLPVVLAGFAIYPLYAPPSTIIVGTREGIVM